MDYQGYHDTLFKAAIQHKGVPEALSIISTLRDGFMDLLLLQDHPSEQNVTELRSLHQAYTAVRDTIASWSLSPQSIPADSTNTPRVIRPYGEPIKEGITLITTGRAGSFRRN